MGATLTEEQTGEVQRDERDARGLEHDSSSPGVRLARWVGSEKSRVRDVPAATFTGETRRSLSAAHVSLHQHKNYTHNRRHCPDQRVTELFARAKKKKLKEKNSTAVVGRGDIIKVNLKKILSTASYISTGTGQRFSPSQLLTDHHNAAELAFIILSCSLGESVR